MQSTSTVLCDGTVLPGVQVSCLGWCTHPAAEQQKTIKAAHLLVHTLGGLHDSRCAREGHSSARYSLSGEASSSLTRAEHQSGSGT